MASAPLQDRLVRFLESKVPGQAVDDQTPLLTSGLLDSLALLDLLLWIEEEIGTTIDPALITNPTTDLNTVVDIVRVITATQDDV